MPDREDHVTEMAERDRERTERVEEVLEDELDGASYPTNTSELAREYADSEVDLPNETESLGDVFDRMAPEEYETPEDAREAVLGELTGPAGAERGDEREYNSERELDAIDRAEGEEEP